MNQNNFEFSQFINIIVYIIYNVSMLTKRCEIDENLNAIKITILIALFLS